MKRALLLLAAVCCLLTGCSLLPQEDEIRNVPLVPEYTAPDYTAVTVERGDLILKYAIGCEYTMLRQENLRFQAEGIAYGQFYTAVGQEVKAGQLLAELDTSSLNAQIDEKESTLERNRIQLQTLEEKRALSLERRTLSMQGSSPEELQEALAEVNAQYDRQRSSLDDEKELLELELSILKDQRETYRLYAGMDGVVTRVYTPKETDVSKKGVTAVTVTDLDSCIFKAETELWEYFTPEETVLLSTYNTSFDANGKVVSTQVSYEAVLVTEQELGLEETQKLPGEKATLYFRLTDSGITVNEKTPYFIDLELDSRKDVLILPEKAISFVDEKPIVYCLAETGILEIRYIEIGLTANGYVEILSGLTEGDTVIQR